MKFKVGDKVKVVRDCGINMSLYERHIDIGDEYVIESINPNSLNQRRDNYGLVGCTYVVYETELELVEPKPFTKADLKDGMVIEYRNGDRCVVINGYFMKPTGYGWMPIDEYYDELHCKGSHPLDREYDVVKVYSSKAKNMPDYCDASKLTLIWERKEEPDHKEMTVEEIEEELGYKIKVIADK